MSKYHLVVIGGGPGGYPAAIRASQLGFKVGLIEREKLGGICLNWGCIPTKALLESAHRLESMKTANEFGLKADNIGFDFSKIIQRSRKVSDDVSRGVDYLMKKHKIDVITGTAKLLDAHRIQITSGENISEIDSDRIILSTGARSRNLPGITIDQKDIIGYREAMVLSEVPKELCVVGAGAIGMEFADFYTSMGSAVTILEALPQILPIEDEESAKVVESAYKKRGIQIETGVRVTSAKPENNKVNVEYQTSAGETKKKSFDKLLLAAGIQANTENLGLEELGIRKEKDKIFVDDHYRTSVNSIYAIGDCIPTPALAHVATAEGIRAAEAIYSIREKTFHYEPLNYDLVPSCTYCHPNVASVGLTEKKAKERGLEYKVGRFPFRASGRARASGESDGFVKILIDPKHGAILGAHIVGEQATELISEIVVGASLELVAENFARTMHAHPTLSESVMEAAADALGEAIHI